jgi:hypothetical protein
LAERARLTCPRNELRRAISSAQPRAVRQENCPAAVRLRRPAPRLLLDLLATGERDGVTEAFEAWLTLAGAHHPA